MHFSSMSFPCLSCIWLKTFFLFLVSWTLVLLFWPDSRTLEKYLPALFYRQLPNNFLYFSTLIFGWVAITKEVYRRNAICKNLLLQKRNRSIYLANCFFQMLAVILMRKATDFAPLIFLTRASRSYKAKVLTLHFPKHWNWVST